MKVTVKKEEDGSLKDGATVKLTLDSTVQTKTTSAGVAIFDNDSKQYPVDTEVEVFVMATGCFATPKKTIKFELNDPEEKTASFEVTKEGKLLSFCNVESYQDYLTSF